MSGFGLVDETVFLIIQRVIIRFSVINPVVTILVISGC